MSRRDVLYAGWASVDYTPEPGLTVAGQMQRRVAERARDRLTADALALRVAGQFCAVVSADILFLPSELVRAARAAFARRTGLPGDRLLLHATHTHTAPAVNDIICEEPDADFLERLTTALATAAEAALAKLEPVELYAGDVVLDELTYNRRGMLADGSSRMYAHRGMDDFVGTEGPRDGTLSALFTRNRDGAITGVLANFGIHPVVIGSGCFYSADLPGEARRAIRDRLGDVGVVYLTGPCGDLSPTQIDPRPEVQPWVGEQGLARGGAYLADALVKLAGSAPRVDVPELDLQRTTLTLTLREWPAVGAPTFPLPLVSDQWPNSVPYYESARASWPERRAAMPCVPADVAVLRLGDVALCTNPAELFAEYGLALRRLSPARVTLLSELTDGYIGYVPSHKALSRGGYETWTAPSSQLTAEAGDRLVEATHELLGCAFGE